MIGALKNTGGVAHIQFFAGRARAVASNGSAVSGKILAAKTGRSWIGCGNQRVPSHRIQTDARCEKQLRGAGNSVAQDQYRSLLTGLQAVGQIKGWTEQQIVFVVVCGRGVRIHSC
jgi:hypothetical protein